MIDYERFEHDLLHYESEQITKKTQRQVWVKEADDGRLCGCALGKTLGISRERRGEEVDYITISTAFMHDFGKVGGEVAKYLEDEYGIPQKLAETISSWHYHGGNEFVLSELWKIVEHERGEIHAEAKTEHLAGVQRLDASAGTQGHAHRVAPEVHATT